MEIARAVKIKRLRPFMSAARSGCPSAPDAALDSGREDADGVGGLLVAFSLYNWLRPKSAFAGRAGPVADGAVGIVMAHRRRHGAGRHCGGRVVQFAQLAPGGAARRFSAGRRRDFVMIALWLGGTGMIGPETAGLFYSDCRRSRSAPGQA